MRNLAATFATVVISVLGFATPVALAEDETKSGPHVLQSEVHFEFDSAVLSDSGRAQLDTAVAWIADKRAETILIEGYADQSGTEPYNKQLAERRAETARQYLIARGVAPERIQILSYGEGLPAVDSGLPERMNRRIVLHAVQAEPIIETRTKTVSIPVEKQVIVPRVVEVPGPAPAPREPFGFEVLAGGGVTDFIEARSDDVTDLGGMWTARFVGGTRSLIGFEAAYVGTSQALDVLGAGSDAVVMGQGVEGNLRLNFTRGMTIQPYLFAGLGWTRYNVTDVDAETASIEDEDDVLHIPAGAGVSLRFTDRITFDLRAALRGAAGDAMFEGAGDADSGMDSWSTSAQAGFAF
jgi:hypothetical protein